MVRLWFLNNPDHYFVDGNGPPERSFSLSACLPRFGLMPQYTEGYVLPPKVSRYAKPSQGSKWLKLYEAKQKGIPEAWAFAARPNAQGGVAAFTIYKDPATKKDMVFLEVTRRPPMGGNKAPLTIELPAGLWGDKGAEPLLQAGNREVTEETGLSVKYSRTLANQLFATSPGMTNEVKGFTFARVQGTPSRKFQEKEENSIIVSFLPVPLQTFVDYSLFAAWLEGVNKAGYIVSQDVITARGLLPFNVSTNRLNQWA